MVPNRETALLCSVTSDRYGDHCPIHRNNRCTRYRTKGMLIVIKIMHCAFILNIVVLALYSIYVSVSIKALPTSLFFLAGTVTGSIAVSEQE